MFKIAKNLLEYTLLYEHSALLKQSQYAYYLLDFSIILCLEYSENHIICFQSHGKITISERATRQLTSLIQVFD